MGRDKSDNDLDLIEHMVVMSHTAQRLIVGAKREDLDHDEKLQLALVLALQIVGEAAWRTSTPFQAAHPSLVVPRDNCNGIDSHEPRSGVAAN